MTTGRWPFPSYLLRSRSRLGGSAKKIMSVGDKVYFDFGNRNEAARSSARYETSRRNVLATAVAASAALFAPSVVRGQTRGLDNVRIVNASGNLTATFEALIQQQGFFGKFGVASKPVFVADGSKIMGSLIAGDMDICHLVSSTRSCPTMPLPTCRWHVRP